MSKDVTVTVSWAIKPECTGAFVAALEGMVPVTRLREGFRNIRLLKGDTDAGQFLLVEEWDAIEHFQAYAQFRVETGDTETLLAMTAEPPQLGVWSLDPVAAARA